MPGSPAPIRRLVASLLVTTDRAGDLVMVRDEGARLNIHFGAFAAPMVLALRRERIGHLCLDAGRGVP
jgi:hypothetical protein